jgi:hypothetical protein
MSKELNLLEKTLRRLNNGPNFNKGKTQRRNQKKRGGNIQNPPNRKTSRPKRSRRSKAKSSSGRIQAFPSGMGRNGGLKHKPTIITDDENLGIINSSGGTAFSILGQYAINPGQASTFPWLSSIAKNYEKYEFLMLEFYIVPQVSGFATAGQTGEVVLSVDYDASDAAPATYQQQVDVWPHSCEPPPMRQRIMLNPKEMHKESDAKFVRPGGLLGGTDIKTYDCGNLFLGAVGISGGAVPLFSLHVRYSVKFTVPILENFAQAPQNNSVTFLVDSAAALTTTTPYQPLLAAVASTALPITNGLNVVNTVGSIVPAPGNYLLHCSTVFRNTTIVLSICILNVLKNGVVQNPTPTGFTAEYDNTSASTGLLTLNTSQFISCNGTDAITLSVEAVFASGTASATTTFMLTAI